MKCECGHEQLHHTSWGDCLIVNCGCQEFYPATVAPHRFTTDSEEPSRVKWGEEDIKHCAACGQAEDRNIHRIT